MSEHQNLESEVAAWVLGALDADEADVVRTHIEACPICRESALRLGRAVSVLPLDVEEITPPARLRERILAAASVPRNSAVAPARPRAVITEDRPTQRPKILAGHFRSAMPAYAAAAVVLALVIGLVGGGLIGRGGPAPASVVRSTLVGHQSLTDARASVIDLKSDGVALVDFSGLPQLDSGSVYEIWLITAAGHADPAGVFVPDNTGSKFVLVTRSLAGYTVMAVTKEVGPAGTQAPTQQPELYGNLGDPRTL